MTEITRVFFSGWVVLKNKKYLGDMPEQTVRTTIPLVQELSGARHWKKEDLQSAPSTDRSSSPVSASSKPLITEVSSKVLPQLEKSEKSKPSFTLRKVVGYNGDEDLLAEVNLPGMVSN